MRLISEVSCDVLYTLNNTSKQLTISKIAKITGRISCNVVTRIYDMKNRGFVEINVNPRSKREKIVSLTTQGEELAQYLEKTLKIWGASEYHG